MFEARVESCITQHAWNGDRTMLAVCPNDSTVIVLKKPSTGDGQWERVATLSEHDALVTDIAWAPRTNRIVTTSQDRNAYVWTQDGTEWKPMLVILRITAAATSVRWCGQIACLRMRRQPAPWPPAAAPLLCRSRTFV
jgi:actin related protein 2/3 complex subunit 1A/1B